MLIPTENVGSLPRPTTLQIAIAAYDSGSIGFDALALEQDAACKNSVERMEPLALRSSRTASKEPPASRPIRSPTPWPVPVWPTILLPTDNISRSSMMATTANCLA